MSIFCSTHAPDFDVTCITCSFAMIVLCHKSCFGGCFFLGGLISQFEQVRPCGFTPLASTCDRKILRPFFERISKLSPSEVKGMIIYCITDGAPTTERGMPTTITTYKMLEYLDQTLVSLKLPRKTIGFNVTQIGMCRVWLLRLTCKQFEQVSTMLPQSFCRSWTSIPSLETASMLSAIMSLRWYTTGNRSTSSCS